LVAQPSQHQRAVFTFQTPVTVTIHYSDADVAGIDESSLTLEHWNGSSWEDAACGAYNRQPDENWLAAPICHLSLFALFGPAAEEEHFLYVPLVLNKQQSEKQNNGRPESLYLTGGPRAIFYKGRR
jgi:hypothetical protein